MERSRKTDIGEHSASIDAARARYEEACASYVLLDGEIWHSCREPLLSVNIGHSSARRGEISVFDGELPEASPVLMRNNGFPGRKTVLFSMGEMDKAREISASVPRPSYPPPGKGFVVNEIRRDLFQDEFPFVQDTVRIICDIVQNATMDKGILPRARAFLHDDTMWDAETAESLLEELWLSRRYGSIEHALERIRNRPISAEATQSPFHVTR